MLINPDEFSLGKLGILLVNLVEPLTLGGLDPMTTYCTARLGTCTAYVRYTRLLVYAHA